MPGKVFDSTAIFILVEAGKSKILPTFDLLKSNFDPVFSRGENFLTGFLKIFSKKLGTLTGSLMGGLGVSVPGGTGLIILAGGFTKRPLRPLTALSKK